MSHVTQSPRWYYLLVSESSLFIAPNIYLHHNNVNIILCFPLSILSSCWQILCIFHFRILQTASDWYCIYHYVGRYTLSCTEIWRIYISDVSSKTRFIFRCILFSSWSKRIRKRKRQSPKVQSSARFSLVKSFSKFQQLPTFLWSPQLESRRNWEIYISNQIHWWPWQYRGECGVDME